MTKIKFKIYKDYYEIFSYTTKNLSPKQINVMNHYFITYLISIYRTIHIGVWCNYFKIVFSIE
jgi:hypothetical protein